MNKFVKVSKARVSYCLFKVKIVVLIALMLGMVLPKVIFRSDPWNIYNVVIELFPNLFKNIVFLTVGEFGALFDILTYTVNFIEGWIFRVRIIII